MIVLGLETSCDETGLALYDSELGLRGQVLYSQIKLHAEYGGVVPELASRDHVRKLIPLMNQLLEQSGVKKQEIDAVAYTRTGFNGSVNDWSFVWKNFSIFFK